MSDVREVERLILAAFTKQSERDKQVKLGPSEVGGCAYCVAHTMSQKLPDAPPRRDDGFGYAAHIGTMCHFWLEHNLDLGPGYTMRKEEKLYVGEVPGYGEIHGHCDLSVEELGGTFDWKFPGKFSYDKVKLALKKRDIAIAKGEPIDPRLHLPKQEYRFQQQLYMHGQRLLGRDMSQCYIVFFPRHTNDINDVIFYVEEYNPAMVEGAFARLNQLWEIVQAGQLDNIASDPDCYCCNTHGR